MEARVLLSRTFSIIQRISRTEVNSIFSSSKFSLINGNSRGFVRCGGSSRQNSTLTSTSTSSGLEVDIPAAPTTKNDHQDVQQKPKRIVNSPDNSRLFKVAIIGLPNAGKSTLVNSLMSLGVCPVSKRVHTTRTNQKAVLLQDEVQVIFVDTPGLVNMKDIKKFSFSKDFVFGPEKSISMADIVAVIHDISSPIVRNKLDPRIIGVLQKFPEKNSILILNKVDTVKSKGVLLDTIRILSGGLVGGKPVRKRKSTEDRRRQEERSMDMDHLLNKAKTRLREKNNPDKNAVSEEKMNELAMLSFSDEEIKEGLHLQGYSKFHDIFMISALHGDGTNLLKNYFITNAQPASWMFNEDFLTDVDPKELAVRIIKSKLLDHLPQEMPYQLKPKIEYWEKNENDELRIIVLLQCPNERYIGRVIGTGATIIRAITSESESILADLLRVHVSLNIKVFTDEKKEK